jgi:regulatory protein
MNFSFEDVIDRVYIKLLNFLSYRTRSEKELDDRMYSYLSKETAKEDISDENVEVIKEAIIKRLKSDGYYNDEKFAEDVVASQNLASHSKNRRKIQTFLYQKGISKEVIDNALEKLDVEKEYENAKADFEKKLKQLESKPMSDHMRLSKVKSYLFSKGYSNEVISAITTELTEL